ncbi:MAG: H(+)/Cl(-) exchange transporter ClcA [Armatimonadetes bacterium]|nr:H(+)/Cl(-) exchange transporter ClcA [Armatimonadota bacterium]
MSEANIDARHIEEAEYLETRAVRSRLLPRAVLVGIAAGLVAVAFRFGIDELKALRLSVATAARGHAFQWFALTWLIVTAGAYFGVLIAKLEPDASGSGIPQMKAVLEGHLGLNWVRLLWVKFTGALVALGSGLAMGREGPTVQMGGAIGHGIAGLTGVSGREQRALAAAGAGAGLAAAFNAPLAGVTFVLEELQRDFQPVVFAAALLCATVATVVSRFASGSANVFSLPDIPAPPLSSIWIFIAIGLAGGVLSVLFNRCLLGSMSFFSRTRQRSPLTLCALVGFIFAGAAIYSPDLLGGGHTMSEHALAGAYPLVFALGLFAIRFLLIHLCYATGAPGGVFAPLLSLGAVMGLVMMRTAAQFGGLEGVALAACVVAGMSAMFSGIVRAPLTGVILIVEMTGSYDLLLPLLITAFTSYAVAEGMKSTPLYEALLQRFMEQRVEAPLPSFAPQFGRVSGYD